MIDMPYTSCSVLSSAITMDKVASKHLSVLQEFLHQIALFIVKQIADRNLVEEIADKFSMPVVVKAASQGSSIGVEIVEKKRRFTKKQLMHVLNMMMLF